MLPPKVRIQQIPRDRLDKDAPGAPHEVQIDALADENVAAEEDLVVQGPWRDGPAREPEEADTLVEAGGVELALDEVEGGDAVGGVQVVGDAEGGGELVVEGLVFVSYCCWGGGVIVVEGVAGEGEGLEGCGHDGLWKVVLWRREPHCAGCFLPSDVAVGIES